MDNAQILFNEVFKRSKQKQIMGQKKDSKSKENIIKNAFILFLKKGFKQVTIKDIIEKTGLSKGAIYHHFASKEDIYKATLNTYYFNLLNADVNQLMTDDFKENVAVLYQVATEVFSNIENLSEEGLDFPIRNFFNFQLESEINDGVRSEIAETVQKYRKATQTMVENAIKAKQIRSDIDSEILALQIIGLIEGTAINHSTVKGDIKKILMALYQPIFEAYFKMVCSS